MSYYFFYSSGISTKEMNNFAHLKMNKNEAVVKRFLPVFLSLKHKQFLNFRNKVIIDYPKSPIISTSKMIFGINTGW